MRTWVTAILLAMPASAQDLAATLGEAERLYDEALDAEIDRAVELIEQALDLLRDAPRTDGDQGVAYLRWMLALEAGEHEAWSVAERSWRAALPYYERVPGPEGVYLRAARAGLAVALARQPEPHKKREARDLQRQILDSWLPHRSPDSDEVLAARRELAVSLTRHGENQEALDEWRVLEKALLERMDEEGLHDARINLCDIYEFLDDDMGLRATAHAMDERATATASPRSWFR